MNSHEQKKNIYFWTIFFVLILASISVTAYKDFVLQDIKIVGEEEVIDDSNTVEDDSVLEDGLDNTIQEESLGDTELQ